MKLSILIPSLLLTSGLALGAEVKVDWRYQDADTQALKTQVAVQALPEVGATDAGIQKTIFVARLASRLAASLGDYEQACKQLTVSKCFRPADAPASKCFPPLEPPVRTDCTEAQTRVARELFARINDLNTQAGTLNLAAADAKIADALDLARGLAANMEKNAGRPVYRYPGEGFPKAGGSPRLPGGVGMPAPLPQSKAGGLGVTTGGAKDIAYLRKLIGEGAVPPASALVVEGFMSEFDLPLATRDCRELICLQPAAFVDKDARKLYVQLGLSSALTAESFHRKPLNLALVVDISGSMSSLDGTEKSRVEWAKEASIHTINQLGERDTLSVVVFDDVAETIVAPTHVVDRAALIAKVNTLQPRGSTNLEAGLHLGYDYVSKNIAPGTENRVILISDAGLNTGVTDEAVLMKEVSDFAGEHIGLTAIGVGDNFNEKFVRHITESRGGNYLFVQSGRRMIDYFHQFDFFVSPVAYDLKATLALEGLPATLAKAYGIPRLEGQPLREVLDIRSLFLASSGGGALLLEYDLK